MSWRFCADWAKSRRLSLGLADFLGRGRGRMRWLDSLGAAPPPVHRPTLDGWEDAEVAAIWIGHATVLLRIGGMTLLTDPVMGNRVGLGLGLFTGGPRRYTAPALRIEQLPPIDLLILSHGHFDHLCRPTLSRLPKRIPVITASHTRDLVEDLGFRHVKELRWGESIRAGTLRIEAQQVRHWGARTFYDHHRGFNAYLIETLTDPRRRVLYGGDTAYHEGFKSIGKVDLAIMGIGAYDPYIAAHATPEQAYAMADHVRAEHILPMHHSTFRLSHEPMDEPIQRILCAAGRDRKRVVIERIGQRWDLN